ncbi:hypothetical protein C8R42DRAFT_638950 [Lentinula raphanica]|nr:hypothetical protein C8R42DRAFT_638950 [Lentinula raphanica]
MSWFTKLRKFIAQAIYPGSNDELVKKETVQSTPLLSNTTGFQTLPVFDQNGIQIGFQCVAAQPSSVPAAISLPGQLPSSSTIPIPSLQLPQTSKNWTELPTLDLSNPAPLTKFIPLDPQPPYSCEFDNGIVATALSHLPNGEWDSWPNGRFRHLEKCPNALAHQGILGWTEDTLGDPKSTDLRETGFAESLQEQTRELRGDQE